MLNSDPNWRLEDSQGRGWMDEMHWFFKRFLLGATESDGSFVENKALKFWWASQWSERLQDYEHISNLNTLVLSSDRIYREVQGEGKGSGEFVKRLWELIENSSFLSNSQVIEDFALVFQDKFWQPFPFDREQFEQGRKITATAWAISVEIIMQYEEANWIKFTRDQKDAVNFGVKRAVNSVLYHIGLPHNEIDFKEMVRCSVRGFAKIIPAEINNTTVPLEERVFIRVMDLWGVVNLQ